MAQNLLASPPAAPGAANNTSTSTTSNSNNNNATTSPLSANKQSPNQNQQRLAVLRVKRLDLEKRLQEKNSLLQELCRKEAHLIGVYPTVTVAGQEGHHQHHNPSSSADDIGGLLHGSGKTAHNTHSLPRKIGTGFTLSEKYLNKRAPSANSPLNAPAQREDEELNSLLLQRDIQQQICKASLKLLNDVALTKSVRRKHKHSYEAAQQKLMDIGKGLTGMQRKQQHEYQHPEAHHPGTSQTLPLTVKTNFKVPQPQQQQQYSGESPIMDRMNVHQQQQQKRNRHDSYSNPHHSPASTGYPSTSTGDGAGGHNKGLYRSSSNSSSLNNATVLGKSSLSLDNSQQQLHQHSIYATQQQSVAPQHHLQQFSSLGQAKPTSYESKSLHNFVMSSPNHSAASYQTSPHHHPALLSPTFYHHQSYAMTATATTAGRSAQNHYPSNSASLRQSHQQFMSPPPQQVVIPQSGLGGYWTLNENNERVWCASASSYSPDPSQPPPPTNQRYATLDRKQAIYVPNSSASHGKLKMPSPEASPTSHNGGHSSQGHHSATAHQDGGYNNNSGKSFSIPNKSTSLGNIEFLQVTSSSSRPATMTTGIRKGGGAEDTASLGSFNSDTNNNPSVYHNLVSAMAGTKVSHYPGPDDDDDEDTENNNNCQAQELGRPPPLRPKSSASQHAPEKSWYETSLDKVVTGGGGGAKLATKTAHKPPALLPREMNLLQAPQLHIDIPTSPIYPQQQQLHHQQLERSLSHRIAGSNFPSSPSSTSAVSPPPPIMRQHSMSGQHHPHQQDVELNSPVSAHKKLSTSNSYHGGGGGGNNNGGVTTMASGSNNAANNVNNNNNLSAPRRTQSNVLMAGQQQQQQQQSPSTTTTTALLSPRLVNGQASKVATTTEDGAAIQVESPKNMTVVQQGKFQPYKEESKPFEMSDFYKYSTKFRQQGSGGGGNGGNGKTGEARSSSRNNMDENLYRGNVLYREEQQQQQQQRGYSELADVANNNSSNNRGNSNNHHNNTNAPHILQPKNGGSNSTVYGQSGASNATASNGGGQQQQQQQYPISYQQ